MDGVLVDFESATSKILNDLIDNPEEHQDNRKLYKAILKAKKEVGDKEITSDHFNFGSPYKKVIDLMFRARSFGILLNPTSPLFLQPRYKPQMLLN